MQKYVFSEQIAAANSSLPFVSSIINQVTKIMIDPHLKLSGNPVALMSTSPLDDVLTKLQSGIAKSWPMSGVALALVMPYCSYYTSITHYCDHCWACTRPTHYSFPNDHLAIGTRPGIHHDVTKDLCSTIVLQNMILEIWVKQHWHDWMTHLFANCHYNNIHEFKLYWFVLFCCEDLACSDVYILPTNQVLGQFNIFTASSDCPYTELKDKFFPTRGEWFSAPLGYTFDHVYTRWSKVA